MISEKKYQCLPVFVSMVSLGMKSLKTFVQVLALVFFSLQMWVAIRKYLTKPSMNSPTKKSLTSLQRPIIIAVCKESQFQYGLARNLGYGSSSGFLTGTSSDETSLSWNSLTQKLTFNETFRQLYISDLHNISFNTTEGNITQR